MPPLLGQIIDDTLKLVDKGAAADFKWWFFGLLLAVLGCAVKLYTRLSARLEKVQDDHTKTLKEINVRQATIIAENTHAYRELAQALLRLADHLPELRHPRGVSGVDERP